MFIKIDIKFEDYKRLVLLQRSPEDTLAEVVNRLLANAESASAPTGPFEPVPSSVENGLFLRGITIPNGTQLAARYKGKTYTHQIIDGSWTGPDGRQFVSPSSAANFITNTNVNGWRFWLAQRPGETQWRRLDQLLIK